MCLLLLKAYPVHHLAQSRQREEREGSEDSCAEDILALKCRALEFRHGNISSETSSMTVLGQEV